MRFLVFSVLASVCIATSGCGSGVRGYIVSMRSHQGDLALASGNLQDAQLAYRLALQLAPNDVHARAGLAQVQIRIAAKDYETSKFEDALAALAIASKYDPQSVRVAALRSEIEQARVNREIVLSNYPTYSETGRALRRSYVALKTLNGKIITALLRFDYTYDAAQLTAAIRASISLQQEVARNTNRLISYRQLVQAGAPTEASGETLAPAASLLPLP